MKLAESCLATLVAMVIYLTVLGGAIGLFAYVVCLVLKHFGVL